MLLLTKTLIGCFKETAARSFTWRQKSQHSETPGGRSHKTQWKSSMQDVDKVFVYLLWHGGREQHCLSVVGTHSDNLLHLLLKVLIQHPKKQNKTQQVSLCFLDSVYRWIHVSSTAGVSLYLSASSRIKISIWVSSKLGVLWRWSISRPGVAIRTSGPALNAASWDFRSNPPGDTQGQVIWKPDSG